MDSFARARLKSENQDLKSQIEELNRKLDIVNMVKEIEQSFKFKQVIEFIKLKNNIIRISKLDDEEERYEMFISQFIQNEKNNDILKRIYPSGVEQKNRYKYYRDLKEIYNRIIHNS